MHSPSALETELIERIAIIRFNRPAERNPLSRSTLVHLDEILPKLCDRAAALIFTGVGDVFASGANIRELTSLERDSAREFSRFGQGLMQKIADVDPITIAAINGYCLGGALDLALACDIRVASSAARFAHPGARLGIITGWGGTQRLPRLISRAHALELFLTAKHFSSDQALQMGLITGIRDPVLEYAVQLARECLAVSSFAESAQFPSDSPQSTEQ
jgi:enoyl-CoA hydratase